MTFNEVEELALLVFDATLEFTCSHEEARKKAQKVWDSYNV